jgi:hypothetical protein
LSTAFGGHKQTLNGGALNRVPPLVFLRLKRGDLLFTAF